MQNTHVPISKWDGKLPPHIAKSEQIWWEVFPQIKLDMPPKISQLLGGAKESPSRETIGKVICIADVKADFSFGRGVVGHGTAGLLNDWGCYCQKQIDGQDTVYMAGTETEPILTFRVSLSSILSLVSLRFGGRIDQSMADAVQMIEQSQIETLKQRGLKVDLLASEVSVVTFKHGSWENGLNIAFKAAIWVQSNREEALQSIWGISV
jgi:hypothetical protein